MLSKLHTVQVTHGVHVTGQILYEPKMRNQSKLPAKFEHPERFEYNSSVTTAMNMVVRAILLRI